MKKHDTGDRSDVRTASEAEATTTCPECEGRLATDHNGGERICSECGLVVEGDRIDRGPEWREFDDEQRRARSRVGPPTTNTKHDKGLSTTIDWKDRDANGNHLDAETRRKMGRLRTWDERFRTRDHRERNLKQALGEIDRMGSALGLPEHAREAASAIYRRASEADLLPGRSLEGVSTASLYAAARQTELPRSLDEFATVSRVDRNEIANTYRYVVRELNLAVEPADPADYVGRFISDLGFDTAVEYRAYDFLETAAEEGLTDGRSPVSLAAAAVYAAALMCDVEVTQKRVEGVTEVSQVTIRDRYRELLRADDNCPL